jgi:hypothetical protein
MDSRRRNARKYEYKRALRTLPEREMSIEALYSFQNEFVNLSSLLERRDDFAVGEKFEARSF